MDRAFTYDKHTINTEAHSSKRNRGGTHNCLICNELQTIAGLELLPQSNTSPKRWYILRDLKRHNAKLPGYKFLEEQGVTVFTPMHWRLITRGGKKTTKYVPFIPDLLFVYESREILDTLVSKTPTLQYRFQKGKPFGEPMTVSDAEMNRFIHAVGNVGNPRYYQPSELSPDMCNQKVRIVGGHLDGYEGKLLTIRGSRVKRLLVELPNWLVAAVEVNPEYIQLL